MSVQAKARFFGRFSFQVAEKTVQDFPTRKAASLLAFLIHEAHRWHVRDDLAAQFWPDAPRVAGRNSLNVALSTIRSLLTEAGAPGKDWVLADSRHVRMKEDAWSSDAASLREALERLKDGDRGSAARVLQLADGEFMEGLHDSWILPLRLNYEKQVQEALTVFVSDALAESRHADAREAATKAIANDRFSALPRELLIRSFVAEGDTAHAIKALEAYEDELAAIGEEPPTSLRTLAHGKPASRGSVREPAGGAVPLDSPFYIERETDGLLSSALRRGDPTILIKGPRQVGKTSLLSRGLDSARLLGRRIAVTDLQALSAGHLTSASTLYREWAEEISEQVGCGGPGEDDWDQGRGPNVNMERFVRSRILEAQDKPVVWALDEVDRLFGLPFSGDFFGLLRSWHNRRSLEPTGPWGRLTVILTYATEAHLFITDLNQSPFNVGTRLPLEDFTESQVQDLNGRYGSPMDGPTVKRLMALVGGHPYLVRKALDELVAGTSTIASLELSVDESSGPFSSHLRQLIRSLTADPELAEALRKFLRNKKPLGEPEFFRLASGGVLLGHAPADARIRCALYERALSDALELSL